MTRNLLFLFFTLIISIVSVAQTLDTCNTSISDTFSYTGSVQSFIIPDGVDSISVYICGAQGNVGGSGGSIQADLSVLNDSILYLYVGGQGTSQYGGWNGHCQSILQQTVIVHQ